ncbi:MAG: phytanoyl-CoA dioxygenase family protein [Saprospiraceae bacterium]|nr:phytanoyl-CoA dioxygenase family protein [Saprospiraceae bacterium]
MTPWHQDAAYWPEMLDKRALSFWIALDDVDKENGCMMYVHGSHHRPIQPHSQPAKNGSLQCEVSDEDDIVYGEITAGTAIAHHGYTLHGALGNKTSDKHRRALIINLGPAMIDLSSIGFDHLRQKDKKIKLNFPKIFP